MSLAMGTIVVCLFGKGAQLTPAEAGYILERRDLCVNQTRHKSERILNAAREWVIKAFDSACSKASILRNRAHMNSEG